MNDYGEDYVEVFQIIVRVSKVAYYRSMNEPSYLSIMMTCKEDLRLDPVL